MSRTIVIEPGRSVIDEVVSHLPKGTVDLRRSLVVFPGKRPAFFLRKALSETARSGLIPPKILSYEALIDFILEEMLRKSTPLLQPIDAVGLLYDIHQSVRKRLGGEHFTSLERFIPLGLKLFSELEELALAGVTKRQLLESVGHITYNRLNALALYFEQFYAKVAAKGFSTRATRILSVANEIDHLQLDSIEQIILAGFYALTPADQRIFKALSHRDTVVFLFQQGPGLAGQMEFLGITPPPPAQTRKTAYRFIKASDTHGQVLALTAQLKGLVDQSTPLDERTAIVLPAPEALFPVLHQTLPLIPEENYNISLGYPLSRTPLYAFFQNLLEVLSLQLNGRLSARSYMKFALHPYTKNILFGQRADVTRVLFHTIEEYLATGQMQSSFTLEELEGESPLFARAARSLAAIDAPPDEIGLKDHLRFIHDRTIRAFLRCRSVREFAQCGIELVRFLHDHTTARRHPLFRPYAERLIETFRSLANSFIAEHKFDDASGFTALLRSYIGAEEVPFPGTPLQGLQVLGLLETRNLQFDRVFILDATDDVLPGQRGAEMMLPQGVREKLGLETYRERERLIEYYFHLLINGAKEVVFFYAEDGKKEKSRFLQKLQWKEEQSEPRWAGTEPQVVRYSMTLANAMPKPVSKSDELIQRLKDFAFTATALDTYLRCQLQFYYRYGLELREREEVSDDIEQQSIGQMVHRVLNEYYRPLVGKKFIPADFDDDRLGKIVENVCVESFGKEHVGTAYLVKEQMKKKLKEFFHVFEAKRVMESEIVLEGVEQEVSVVKEGWNFRGRIDRIEQRNGKIVILDYKIRHDDEPYRIKTKKFRSDDPSTWTDSVQSVQLPMYVLLYSSASGVDPAKVISRYLLLGRNILDEEIEVGLGEKLEHPDLYRLLEKMILQIVEEIASRDVPFKPTSDPKEHCPRCPYQVICGTQWVLKSQF